VRGLEQFATRLSAAQLLGEIITPYLDEMTGVVQEHHGYLAQHDDAGTLTIFGYPAGGPDDQTRALRAAAAMRQAARRLRGRWQASLKCTLGISFGVARGTITAGVIGSEAAPTFTVIGAAVHEARRLQQLARTDEVLIAADLAQELPPDNSFALEALAPIVLAEGTPPRTIYRLHTART
jgi:adenylate cyclase